MTSSTLALSMPFPVKVDQIEGGASMPPCPLKKIASSIWFRCPS